MADTTKATVLAPPAPSTAWASNGEFYVAGEHELPKTAYDDLKARGAIRGTPEAKKAQAEREEREKAAQEALQGAADHIEPQRQEEGAAAPPQ